MSLILPCLVAFLSTAVLIAGLRPLARRVRLVDVPNERKQHSVPTPLVGGLAIFLGVGVAAVLALATAGLPPSRPVLGFFAAGFLLVGVGVVDDRHELSPLARFAVQIVAALIMVHVGGVVLTDLGRMTPSGEVLELGVLAVPFTVFATLGVINALNMCDGLDGLSGSLALVSITGLAVAGLLWGAPGDVSLLLLLGAAVPAFLLYNLRLPRVRQRAVVFMGDAGSMFLGFALTWFAIGLSQGESRAIPPAAALWFIMLPIMDAVAMMLRRIVRGRSPFAPDREHLHHVFQLSGFSVNQTVAIMAGLAVTGVVVALGVAQSGINELLVALLFLALGLLYFWTIMRAWRVMRFVRRSICRRGDASDRRRGARGYGGPNRRSGRDRRQPDLDHPA
jgi:UDP-GlcNAc:undecaprenyl-phosphate GlcNAc-1-phosphate transferase